jgi:hypothetical protein
MSRALALVLIAVGGGVFGLASSGIASTDRELRTIVQPPSDVRVTDRECPFEERTEL